MFRFTISASVAAALTAALTAALPATIQDPQATPAANPAKQEAEKTVALGKTVPAALVLADIDGKAHEFDRFKGRVTVVNFWSTTCPIMKGWEPTLTEIQREYAEKGVTFLMVNSNETNGEIGDKEPVGEDDKPYQKIRDYLAEHELPYTVLVDHDSKIADVFKAKTTPDIFVFDDEAKLVYRGLIDDDLRRTKGDAAKRYLRDTLDKLLAGEAVEPSETRPQGCSIKRPRKEGEGRRGGRRGRG